jgi:hypothetical protein
MTDLPFAAQDAIQAWFAQSQSALACDPACQQARERARLQQAMQDAEIQARSAPTRVRDTQHAYLTFTEGTAAAQRAQQQTWTREATQRVHALTTEWTAHYEQTLDAVEALRIASEAAQPALRWRRTLQTEAATLRDRHRMATESAQALDRVAVYDDEERERARERYRWIWWTYWSVLLAATLVQWIASNQCFTWTHMGILVVALVYPFFIAPLVRWLVTVWHEFRFRVFPPVQLPYLPHSALASPPSLRV